MIAVDVEVSMHTLHLLCPHMTHQHVCLSLCVSAVLGMLYAEEKERLDFVYTIYHWWQAIAIFIVYLWSNLPMRV